MTVIEVEDLHKRYGRRVAVQGVSFRVDAGEIFGVIGPNGAGKTTTVECVEGLRRQDRGTVRVLGLDPHADRAELRRRVGTQLQESHLPDRLKVGEALDLYGSFYPRPADWRALLEEWGLAAIRDAPFGTLSGGQRQRLFIALALVGRPELVVLDELTTGLDPQARRETWALVERIREAGVTVVLVTHFMEEAERLCDRLMLIDAGRVVATGTPADLIARAAPRHRLVFRSSTPLPPGVLAEVPEVRTVTVTGPRVEVTGVGDLLPPVTAVLARAGIAPAELRVERPTLDDAYLALTRKEPS